MDPLANERWLFEHKMLKFADNAILIIYLEETALLKKLTEVDNMLCERRRDVLLRISPSSSGRSSGMP